MYIALGQWPQLRSFFFFLITVNSAYERAVFCYRKHISHQWLHSRLAGTLEQLCRKTEKKSATMARRTTLKCRRKTMGQCMDCGAGECIWFLLYDVLGIWYAIFTPPHTNDGLVLSSLPRFMWFCFVHCILLRYARALRWPLLRKMRRRRVRDAENYFPEVLGDATRFVLMVLARVSTNNV